MALDQKENCQQGESFEDLVGKLDHKHKSDFDIIIIHRIEPDVKLFSMKQQHEYVNSDL